MYDQLEQIENVVEVQLANPMECVRLLAAQVKTGRIDARMLGQLLRWGWSHGRTFLVERRGSCGRLSVSGCFSFVSERR